MTAQPTAPVPTDVNDFLMGNGDGPSAPFLRMGPATQNRPQHTAPGEWKGGEIVALRPKQAEKLGPVDRTTGKPTRIPQFHQGGRKAGQPIWDALVVLQTNERDPQIEGDDGLRQIQLDGFDRYWETTADFDCRKRAARLAVTAAGATGLEVGGQLWMAWERQVPIQGANPATHWVAKYIPPGQSFQFEQPTQPAPALQQAAQQGFAQGMGQAPQAPAQPQAPVSTPWSQPTPSTPSNPHGDPWATGPSSPAPQRSTQRPVDPPV